MSDDALDLAAARHGGAEGQRAWARIYDRHAPVVLSLCRRGTRVDAEDALQEVFIVAHRRLDQLESPDRLRPWLYGIARRVCSDRRRADQRRENRELIATSIERRDAEQCNDRVERSEDLERLTGAMNQLDTDERTALHLYYLERDPVNAASLALGVSRSGYYKLLARAREKLSALLCQEATP